MRFEDLDATIEYFFPRVVHCTKRAIDIKSSQSLTMNMPVDSALTTTQDGDQKKDAFVITFSNGALEQLRLLKEFLKLDNEQKVIEMGISVLQRFKESEQKDTNA